MTPRPNHQQHAVIEHPIEPLRVAAGAGTGKTTTIVQRLVAAVEAGMPPEAAIGITFTNKAAAQLADRLRRALPEPALAGREVEVATYHGFAYSILQEYGALVGVERTARVIGPGYVRQLLLEALPGREYRVLDLTAPNRRVADAASLAASLGDNLIGAQQLVAAAPERLDATWEARLELAAVTAEYESIKRRLDVIDYADLVRRSHQLLSEHPAIATRIRNRYQMVLLDEYQDTAPSQRELLRLIFGEGMAVTAVGDTDQTIYEWRGASRANFDAFPEHFPRTDGHAATTLPLTTNYRSATTIIDAANAIRGELHDDGDSGALQGRPGAPTGKVACRWMRTAVDEATWIASEVCRRHDEEGEAWRSMAVLFRNNRHITLVRDALQDAGVPVEVASLGGLLEVPEVADLHAWLSIIEDATNSVALVRILLGSRYRLGFADLAPLAAWCENRSSADAGPERSLFRAIEAVESMSGLSIEAGRRLTEFRDSYRALVTNAQTLTLVETCRRILDEIDAWTEVDSMDPSRGLSARLNLYRFLDLAQEWSPLAGRPSLGAFLGYLELLSDEGSSDELDAAYVGSEDAVTLLTVHRAKGLEWDTVFVPAVTAGSFPAGSSRYDDPTTVAASLPFELRLDAGDLPTLTGSPADRRQVLRQRHLEGEWRTAYVAVTRARLHLYITGAYWYGGKTPREPSPLFTTISGTSGASTHRAAPEPEDPPEWVGVNHDTAGAPDPLFPAGWQEVLRDRGALEAAIETLGTDRATYDAEVDQLRMTLEGIPDPPDSESPGGVPGTSVTGLVTLRACPQRFYWTEVERLPRRPSPALRRGAAVHRRIELHNLGRMGFADLEHAPDGGAEAADNAGHSSFRAFLGSRFATTRPAFVEAPIDLEVGAFRIRGRIDAIYEPEPGVWEIVDFKTGRHRDDPAAIVQLQAYAVAAASGAIGGRSPREISVTFVYLGGDEITEMTQAVDPAWLASAERSLQRLTEQIDGPAFSATPSGSCRTCDFVRFCDAGSAFIDRADGGESAASSLVSRADSP